MLSFSEIVALAGALASFGTLVVAIVAIIGAARQLREMELNRIADLRPYVSARYILMKGKSDAVKLQLHNAGRTSARNIRISFPDDRAWHYLKNPKFSFVSDGLTVLNPGETMEFFLGQLISGSKFDELRTIPMEILVSYKSGIDLVEFTDCFEVHLGDHAYAMNTSTNLQSA